MLLLTGCISTRYVPDDRYLLSDIDIEMKNDQIDRNELQTHMRQKENLRILRVLKMHLFLYNLSSKKRTEGWLKNIGEPPVLYDRGLKDKTSQQLQQYLYNKGYYRAAVSDTVIVNNKKAKVIYRIETGEPYLISSFTTQYKDSRIASILDANKDESLISEGEVFDVYQLEKERIRITGILKNEGFFKFAEEFIHFQIDTNYLTYGANIEMIIENPGAKTEQGNPSQYHKKYRVADYEIFIEKQPVKDSSERDTAFQASSPGFTFRHTGEMPLRKGLFFKAVEIKPGGMYSKRGEDKTYNNLYALRQFKYVNIQFFEDESKGDSLNGFLKGRIFLPMQVKQNASIDIEGTNTSGNLGIAGNINYQHRNLFGGAEIFDITFKGANERQMAIINNESAEFNTLELGGQTRVTVPDFLLPVIIDQSNLYSTPLTSFSTAYNYQKRPDYTRTIVNATLGYNWRSGPSYSHTLNVLDLNAVRIFSLNPDFINQIQDLYIRSSYTDHIVSATNYSLVFNDRVSNKRPAYHYFRLNIESAGNFLRGLASLTGKEKIIDENSLDPEDPISYYTFFDTRFAQYVKADFDFRYGYRFDKFNSLATRAFIGVAVPYGNFPVMPFEKRYFTGGANGIRAWQVRSLGPGSYQAGDNEYPNQSSDIKMEANLEYRFRLFWILESALFLDAGNVWAINRYDNREGAVFQFDSFYDEFAVGTGLGLRLVTPYFILRTDLGLKLRDPSLAQGQRWIPFHRSFHRNDLNFNIAIGYPF
ncbi:MAG: BamA/TamA family outer membrane protein [Prolixibacteraceae bacterium]|nr:BamA/TamA family outer membrane protein [Prolixibacteraceae bacterium]